MQKSTTLLALLAAVALCSGVAEAERGIDSLRPPIIDMHLHATRWTTERHPHRIP